MELPTFEDVVLFHGHSCPGLAFGYRVTQAAMRRLFADRAIDEDLVAVVENDSCAVDAVQAMAGCTFGKGNLVFLDHGKPVYTFFRRGDGIGLRVAVSWQDLAESEADRALLRRYAAGDRSAEVTAAFNHRKAHRTAGILAAGEEELLTFSKPQVELPEAARLHDSLPCSRCGEKVMATRAVGEGVSAMCIPCAREAGHRK